MDESKSLNRCFEIQPEFHQANGAAHLSFDFPCSEDQLKVSSPSVVCTDPTGFDRTDFYRKFNLTVVDFCREQLAMSMCRHGGGPLFGKVLPCCEVKANLPLSLYPINVTTPKQSNLLTSQP